MQIRYRNIIRDENNVIKSGSATLVENNYVPNKNGNRLQNHSKQEVIERLGKVIWINQEDKRQGIFNSPSRGLVHYDLVKDLFTHVDPTDPRLAGTRFQYVPERIHVNFGNAFLFFTEMEKTPYMNILRSSFKDKVLYEKVLAHLSHDCLRNGSEIKCGDFLKASVLSHILTDIPVSTLDCDSGYFSMLSDDNIKVEFFKSLVQEMRKIYPEFGRACYTDSTPLPGEAEGNPFNALCSHGTDGAVVQSRLVLVMDIQTEIPVWFEIIPSNVLDKSTILSITDDVRATLDITIDEYDLDAGYARQELFELFNRDNNHVIDTEGKVHDHTVLVRMPATNGYPRDELYIQCKPHFYSGRYSFDYEHHTFYGERVEVDLFKNPEYAFVFIDKTQSESLLRRWRSEHQDEWDDLSDLQQDWYQVKDGFFILVGNKDQSPKEALIEYRGRAHIEEFFRDCKSYLKALPLAKWNKQTVTGKIFHDIITTIFYRAYRKQVAPTNMSMSSLIVCMDSWEAYKTSEDLLEIKTPNTQVREAVVKLGYEPLGHMDLSLFRRQILEGIIVDLTPVTQRSRRKEKKQDHSALSPEEKVKLKEQAQIIKMEDAAKRKYDKSEARADHIAKIAEMQARQQRDKVIAKAERQLEKKLEQAKRVKTKEKAQATFETVKSQAEEVYRQKVADANANCEHVKQEAKRIYTETVKEMHAGKG